MLINIFILASFLQTNPRDLSVLMVLTILEFKEIIGIYWWVKLK